MTLSKRLPTARLKRMARLARLGVAGAGTALTGQDPEAMALRAAEHLADMRGLAAKLGQLGSYMDAVLPTDAPDGVRHALQKLNADTTHSPWDDIEAVLRADLPDAPAVLAAMERTPVASGSVAQVYRGTHPERGPVAIKVQHPGVAQVLRAELGHARLLMRTAGALMPGATDAYDQVRARFEDELDQRIEAQRTRDFGHAVQGVAQVPQVVDGWSGDRVLTTTWCEGVDLDTAAQSLPESARTQAATGLLRAFGQGLAHGLVHGDPNAGNFLFQPDGGLVVLDLGCVQPVPQDAAWDLLEALRAADPKRLAVVLGQQVAGPAAAPVMELMEGLLAPWRGVGRVTQDDLHRLGRATPAFKKALLKTRSSAGPDWSPLVLRAWIGLLAHVHHLDAPIDGPAIRAALPVTPG